MSEDGFYYLHENGDLIWKRDRPEVEAGGFVRRVWSVCTKRRGTAWVLASEALALGARRDRVMELKEKWGLTDEDAQEFAKRAGLIVRRDGNQWCATFADFVNLQENQAGFGDTALEALAELAKQGICVPWGGGLKA